MKDIQTLNDLKKLSKEETKKIYNDIPEEEKKILTEKMKMLAEILPITMIANQGDTIDLIKAAQLSEMAMNYCKKFDCSLEFFMRELKIMEMAFMEKYGKNSSATKGGQKHKNKINKKNNIEKKEEKIKPYTLGDAMKSQGIIK